MSEPRPKVLVSGCYDELHSGHIAFLKEAASYGDVYVSMGSDATVLALKNRKSVCSEEERRYMLESIRFVKEVYIGPDTGTALDFAPLLDVIKPDIFFGNAGDEQRKSRYRAAEFLVVGFSCKAEAQLGDFSIAAFKKNLSLGQFRKK